MRAKLRDFAAANLPLLTPHGWRVLLSAAFGVGAVIGAGVAFECLKVRGLM